MLRIISAVALAVVVAAFPWGSVVLVTLIAGLAALVGWVVWATADGRPLEFDRPTRFDEKAAFLTILILVPACVWYGRGLFFAGYFFRVSLLATAPVYGFFGSLAVCVMSAVAVYGFRRSLSRRFYDLHVAQHICDMHEEINRAVSCGDHWGAWRERFRGTVLVIQAVLLHFFTVHWLFTPFVAYATARLIGVEPMKAAQASLAAAVAQVVLRAFVPVPALENRPDAIHEDRNV